jgi:flagellar protein FliO/FliZ
MFDLFGGEMPLAVRFFLAFLIVLGLIGVAAWAVRRFGSGRLGGTGLRGRQPRLSVIERTSVDARRWLYLVRRDNVEHLLLIGGPTDVVVEPNIVRATPAAREVAVARAPVAAEALPRAIPVPESASNGSWPLQPEPAAPLPLAPRRAPRAESAPEDSNSFAPQPHAEKAPRAQREALAALAEDITANPVPLAPPSGRPVAPPRPHALESRADRRPDPRPEHRSEPRLSGQASNPEALTAADKSLAEMAHRLEAALRKPKTADARDGNASPNAGPATSTAEPAADPEPAATASAPAFPVSTTRLARSAEVKSADAKPKEGKTAFETLEEEMASLLGRPTGKT